MANLQRALEIAVESHKNQKQKDGTPYALHPIRLSMSLESEEQKIVALLHDVVEDTNWTFEDLVREGFSESVIEALRLLTHTDGSLYEDYVERLASKSLAKAVKKQTSLITWTSSGYRNRPRGTLPGSRSITRHGGACGMKFRNLSFPMSGRASWAW